MNFDLEEACEVLRRTPSVIREMLDGLSENWTTVGSTPDDWAPIDIVGHLIHGERTDWIPRARIILDQEGDRKFVPFDRLAQFATSTGMTLPDLLEQFEDLRKHNLEILAQMKIGPEELALEGIHPEFGSVTLAQLLATWVVHDLTHIRQMASFMARKYQADVGPWKAYLSILK